MARFFGRFEHSLDIKGRVILPSRFRTSFETRAFLSQHHEGCLALWTPDDFEEQIAQRTAAQNAGPEGRKDTRVWSSNVSEVEMDKQGRVPITPHLRQYAGLDTAVLVIGAIDHVELWDPSAWATSVERVEQEDQ
ncbi:MAG TPA: division/cell wall cluster transcriptional repressor MraZ [Acidimicrobiales bacterium]|nr:division/cell wall cluster transcriptional repressor MraZ [Acidimicrobiales bacterium]